MKKKFIISLGAGGALSILTLYLAFRNVPFDQLAEYLGTINYWWIFPTAGLIMATFVLRVLRWQIILSSTHMVSFWQAFHPLMIGFMMNCILPGRLGEIARPILLKKKRGIPITTGLVTVAAERVFDIVLLIILFAVVFSSITERPDLEIAFGSVTLNSRTLQTIAGGLIRLSLAMLAIMGLLATRPVRALIIRAIHTLTNLPLIANSRFHPIASKAAGFCVLLLDNFAAGISLVYSPLRLLGCVVLTILIWALTVFSYYVFALGCPGVELTLWELTTVMVVICFFIALPSVPGFWGLWEAGGVFALSLFGVLNRDAAGFTLVNHAVQIFPVILIGMISALVTSVNIFKVRYDVHELEPVG